MKTLSWICGAILMTAGAAMITDWRTIAGIGMILLGGYLSRGLTVQQNWVE